jgi:hypothetical protein
MRTIFRTSYVLRHPVSFLFAALLVGLAALYVGLALLAVLTVILALRLLAMGLDWAYDKAVAPRRHRAAIEARAAVRQSTLPAWRPSTTPLLDALDAQRERH